MTEAALGKMCDPLNKPNKTPTEMEERLRPL